MRLLTFTSLYPNAAQPTHGIMVENRLRHLIAAGGFEADVVAPVPRFPFRSAFFGRYGEFARVPAFERRGELEIWHPRFTVVPKIGMSLAPALMARAVLPLVAELHAQKRHDVIDAHYLYPDGVAAARIAQALGLPLVITARGTDVNVLPGFAAPRRMILEAIANARYVITVSSALRDRLIELGAPARQLVVVRNWVDRERFRPMDANLVRARLGLTGKVAVSVGRLDANKGHHLIIDALRTSESWSLLILGSGPDATALQARAKAIGLAERVRFIGAVPNGTLAEYYSAADVTVLASAREGLPNVVLESLACGTPVIATRAGGIPEVLAGAPGCILLDERSEGAIAAALRSIAPKASSGKAVRDYSGRFGAEHCVGELVGLMRAAVRT